MFTKASIVALLAAVASAQHAPVGEPNGNSIVKPGLQEQVPACKPYVITWQPSTPNSVSLILLRGPSQNVVPLKNIVVGIANSGTYTWTPDASLEADVTHYGIQLIDDITGQYQYSTQFGISKGAECNGYVASSSSVSPYNGGGYPASTPAPKSTSSKAGGYPVSSPAPSSKANSTTPIVSKTSQIVISSGYPVGSNSSIVIPTPSGLSSAIRSSTPTSSRLPESTGAASSLKAGFSLVGAVAAMAFML